MNHHDSMHMTTNSTMMPGMHHNMSEGMTHDPGHDMHDDMDMGDMDHSGMGHSMTFYFGTSVMILFEGWNVTTVGGLVGSCIAIFFLAMLYEGLKVFRETLLRRSAVNIRFHSMQISKGSEAMLTETHRAGESSVISFGHIIQTLLHMVQVTVSYFLMLIFMTFNGWLCISVILGAGFGYFLFGWKRAIVVDVNEHCH